MRSVNFALSLEDASGWVAAVQLTSAYLAAGKKSDQLLAELPETFAGERRALCQSLFLGALRHGFRVRAAAQPHMKKPPRPEVEAILLVAGYELTRASDDKIPKIVHHAVESSKHLLQKSESAFLNAILRKLPDSLAQQAPDNNRAEFYSHPDWIVDHWEETFGLENTQKLLEWNQDIPQTYLRVYDSTQVPNGLAETNWPGFYHLESAMLRSAGVQQLLQDGKAYVKDPSTRMATELLQPVSSESILDLCASPGGKAFDLAKSMSGTGKLVAVDLPGPRIARLKENLDKLNSTQFQATILESDVLALSKELFAENHLPATYDAVMLDAPCSNTGVIQRRTDVKWRLRPDDIANCVKLQQQLIHSAARFVKPGGRLVYSTCSIEPEENRQLIDQFLESKSGQRFTLVREAICLPWECRHDGASVALLQRMADKD